MVARSRKNIDQYLIHYTFIIGKLYHYIVRILFGFQLRDVDCDYRLMKREIFERVKLNSTSGTICLEMVKKIQDAGYKFKEVPIHHFHRAHGKSQFFNFRRLFKTGIQLVWLWWELVLRKNHLKLDKNSGGAAGHF